MAKEKNKAFGDNIITGECRVSFPKLDKPDTSKFGQNKYSIDMIFEDATNMDGLKEACKKHAVAFFGTEKGITFPWKDGSELANKYTGYEGNEYARSRTTQKPRIVGRDRQPIDPTAIYAGCYVRCNVTPLAYSRPEKVITVDANGVRKEVTQENKGVTVLLNAVQFVKDGERFGSSSSAGFDGAYQGESAEELF